MDYADGRWGRGHVEDDDDDVDEDDDDVGDDDDGSGQPGLKNGDFAVTCIFAWGEKLYWGESLRWSGRA